MKNIEKNRFVILAVFILIAIALGAWSFLTDTPPEVNVASNVASIIAGLFIIPMVYKIAKEATDSVEAGLFSAALSIAIPLFDWRTVGHLQHTIAIGLFFLTLLLFVLLKQIGDWKKIIVVPLIFAFVHVYSVILIPIFGLYFLFAKLEDKKPGKNELIFAGISSLFIFLIFVFFTASPAFFAIAQQYIGTHYFTIAAENFTLVKAFALVGMIPIYIGFLGAYFGLKMKKKIALLTLSTICVFFVAMAVNVLAVVLGLPYFTIALAIMGSFAYKELKRGLEISRLKKFEKQIAIIVFTLVILFGILHWMLI